MPNPPSTQAERRRSQRFKVSLDGEYQTKDGNRNSITIVNISSSGLQFVVKQADVLTLIPNTSTNNRMSPVSIKLSFNLNFELTEGLTTKNSISAINLICGIVYVQRHSMTSCLVGCRFEDFLDESNERLSSYLATQI